jgi:hypothetical protein
MEKHRDRAEYKHKYYIDHKIEAAEYWKRYSIGHKEQLAKYWTKYNSERKKVPKIRDYTKKYLTDSDRKAGRDANWQKWKNDNRDKYLEGQKIYSKEHKAERKKWAIDHPENILLKTAYLFFSRQGVISTDIPLDLLEAKIAHLMLVRQINTLRRN